MLINNPFPLLNFPLPLAAIKLNEPSKLNFPHLACICLLSILTSIDYIILHLVPTIFPISHLKEDFPAFSEIINFSPVTITWVKLRLNWTYTLFISTNGKNSPKSVLCV